MADLSALSGEEFLSIETFRKNGQGVRTPVWFTQEGDTLHIWTSGSSGKAKRIRNNPRVNIAPCTRSGEITGDWIAAQAVVDGSQEGVTRTEALMRKKIGFMFAVFQGVDALMALRRKSERVAIRVTPV